MQRGARVLGARREVRMTHGFTTSREVAVVDGMTPNVSTLADGARDVLRRHASESLSSSELRAGLRPFVRHAREGGATIEELLVAIKRTWATLPESHVAQGERSETARRLERAVTLVIETYYEP
jgi:hypothetical protein